jgi:hypothetical protein
MMREPVTVTVSAWTPSPLLCAITGAVSAKRQEPAKRIVIVFIFPSVFDIGLFRAGVVLLLLFGNHANLGTRTWIRASSR